MQAVHVGVARKKIPTDRVARGKKDSIHSQSEHMNVHTDVDTHTQNAVEMVK